MPEDKKQHTFDAKCHTPGCTNAWSYTSSQDRKSPDYEKCGNCGKEGKDEKGEPIGIVVVKRKA